MAGIVFMPYMAFMLPFAFSFVWAWIGGSHIEKFNNSPLGVAARLLQTLEIFDCEHRGCTTSMIANNFISLFCTYILPSVLLFTS